MKSLALAAICVAGLVGSAFAADSEAFLKSHPGYAAQKASMMTLSSWSNGACTAATDKKGHVIVDKNGIDNCGVPHKRS